MPDVVIWRIGYFLSQNWLVFSCFLLAWPEADQRFPVGMVDRMITTTYIERPHACVRCIRVTFQARRSLAFHYERDHGPQNAREQVARARDFFYL